MSWEQIDCAEDQEQWLVAIDATYIRWRSDPLNLYTLIRLGFLCWYIVVEWGIDVTSLSDDDYDRCEDLLKEVTDFGLCQFANDPEFLWVFGYMIQLFPWHFGDALHWEEKGYQMLAEAHAFKPTDPIIKMLYLNGEPTDEYECACRLSKPLLAERFRGRGAMATYFREMLNRNTKQICLTVGRFQPSVQFA